MDRKERQTTSDPAPPLTIATCPRCEKLCLLREPHPRLDYGLAVLVPATATRGLCEECAAHWWLMTVDGIRWALTEERGFEILQFRSIQSALSDILGQMHPALGQLDWGRLIAQWDLPWPDDWKLPKDGINA